MTQFLQKFITIRYILSTFIILLISGLLLTVVYAWTIGSTVQNETEHQEQYYLQKTTTEFNSALSETYAQLALNYYSESGISPSLIDSADIGVIQSKAGKLSILAFNNTKITNLTNFAKTVSTTTPQYTFDTTTNCIYISFIKNRDYEIGAIDISGQIISNILASPMFHTFLISYSGNILYTNTTHVQSTFIQSLHLQYAYLETVTIGNLHREALTYEPLTNINLGIAILSDPITNTVISLTKTYLLYIMLLLLSILLSLIIVFSILVDIPLTRITVFFDDFAQGKINTLHIKKKDGFGMISEQINNLIKKVSNDSKRVMSEDAIQNDFLHLSAHLLRTPITSTQGYLDLIKAKNTDTALTEIISNAEIAINKLSQLEENILALSEENDKMINAPVEKVVVRDLLETIYKQTLNQVQNKHITFLLDIAEFQMSAIIVNQKAIIHAITNLIDNAIKFTPENGTIKLYGRVQNNQVLICISDTGIGLTKEEVGKLFKKFSKISDTMEYNSDGFGIGLYVVKLIVERYNGRVWVDSIKGSGSIFNILLPLEQT